MAVISVAKTNTFEQWRQLTNQLGSAVGDISTLTTNATTNLVAAINELDADIALVDSKWTVTGSDIYYDDGKVAIGVTGTPTYTLDVRQTTNGAIGSFRITGQANNYGVQIWADETSGDVGFDTISDSTDPDYVFSVNGAEVARLNTTGVLNTAGYTITGGTGSFILDNGTVDSNIYALESPVWAVKTTSYVAVAGDYIFMDCTTAGAPTTITLPVGTDNDKIKIAVELASAQSVTIDLTTNVQTVNGSSSNIVINTDYAVVEYTYINGGWIKTQ